MASFTFNQASGTQLPTIDVKWVHTGNYGRVFETKGTYLDVTSNYTTAWATYQNGQGTAQLSRYTRAANSTPLNSYVVVQSTALNGGYSWQVDASAAQIRKGSTFLVNSSHTENVSTAQFTAEISIDGSGNIAGKVNGTTYCTYFDATPLTGGYPGFQAANGTTLTSVKIVDWTDGVGGVTNTAVNPGVASLTLTGFAPTVVQDTRVNPGVASLAISGFAPSVVQDTRVAPGAAVLLIAGYAPTVAQTANQSITPGAALMVFTGYAPIVTVNGMSSAIVEWLTRARRRGIR